MRKGILIITVLFMSLNVFAKAPVSRKFHQKRLIVKLKEGETLPKSSKIISSMNLFKNIYVVRTNSLLDLEKILKVDAKVLTVSRDYYANREALPAALETEKLTRSQMRQKSVLSFNDPGLKKVWAFSSSTRNGMSVTDAYKNYDSTNAETIIVAVVDTGVDYNHEDLKDVMWVNEGEIPGNGIDDDRNGYIDDIHGINTLVRDREGNATVDMMDRHGHGTHVSGTIGATQNNQIGIAGVAGNIRIMGIRTVPNRSDETDIDVAEAFIYAAKNGARVINCSFGKAHNEGGELVKETIDHIGATYGTLVVAAAGNDSKNIDRSPAYPAAYDSKTLLVVASTTKRGGMSFFSNFGKIGVDVAAPGSSIYSTTRGNSYGYMSGTSMAAPNASGVAAEILSRHPHFTPLELKELMMRTVTRNSSHDDITNQLVSGGLLNLNTAVRE